MIDSLYFLIFIRPFWLEKFNALSGQFSSLERELLNNSNLLKEFLLEPSAVPQNSSIPTDSIPNILLRSKLAPEVIEPMIIKNPEEASDLQVSIFKKALLGLQEKFSIIQEDLQRAAGEHASLLLAKEIVTSSGTATPKGKMPEEDMDVILEASIRWLYTGVQ